MREPGRRQDLRSLYQSTFGEWASQVGRLEQIRDSVPKSRVLKEAQNRTMAAEASYREVRNRLTEEMLVGRMSPESARILKIKVCLKRMEDRKLQKFLETCEQLCASAIRRGTEPPVSFALQRRLAVEELTRRSRERFSFPEA